MIRLTHFVRYDEPGRRRRRALCGLLVDVRDHADPPTCPDCLAALAAAEASVGP